MSFDDEVARAVRNQQLREHESTERAAAAAASAAALKRTADRCAGPIEHLITTFQRAWVAQGMPGSRAVPVRVHRPGHTGPKKWREPKPFTIQLAITWPFLSYWFTSWSAEGSDGPYRHSHRLVVGRDLAWLSGRARPYSDSWDWLPRDRYDALVARGEKVDGLHEYLAKCEHPEDVHGLVYKQLVAWTASEAPSLRLDI